MARDDRWKACEGTWDRLKWARLQKFSAAKEAALAMGVNEGTYRAYEREPGSSKHIPLDHQNAFHFARRLGVRWEWLLFGQGAPWADADENRDRIMRAFDEVPEDRRSQVADAIEALLQAHKRTGTDG